MTSSIATVLIWICVAFAPTLAQEVVVDKDEGKPRRLFHSYFSFGGSRKDVKDLNQGLGNAELPDISENNISAGIGMDAVYGRFVHSMGLDVLFWDEGNQGNLETDLTGFYGRMAFGFDIFSKERFRLYPQIGLGLGALRLRINSENVGFEEALTGPSQTSEFWQMGVLLGVSLGGSYTFGIDKRDKNIVLGFRGGYWHDPSSRSDWFYEYADVQNGPEAGFSGPYAKLTIGKEISGKNLRRRWNRW
ncbi:MAG: hypothetical protein ACOC41_05015 [Chitinivibrionales bacterium]